MFLKNHLVFCTWFNWSCWCSFVGSCGWEAIVSTTAGRGRSARCYGSSGRRGFRSILYSPVIKLFSNNVITCWLEWTRIITKKQRLLHLLVKIPSYCNSCTPTKYDVPCSCETCSGSYLCLISPRCSRCDRDAWCSRSHRLFRLSRSSLRLPRIINSITVYLKSIHLLIHPSVFVCFLVLVVCPVY